MPIYRNAELIHIHIPKTGGTAIERFFDKMGDLEWNRNCFIGEEKKEARWYELQHLAMAELLDRAEKRVHDYDSFAVVRNPYSRLVSDYRWRQQITQRRPNSGLAAFNSFAAFVEAIPTDMDSRWDQRILGTNKSQANFLIHVRPQHHYIFSMTGEKLVSEIFRFESLGEDFDRLCHRLGYQNSIVKPGKDIDYMAYYEQKIIERVNQIYARDFSLGGYSML